MAKESLVQMLEKNSPTRDEIINFIKEKTGSESFVLIVFDSPVPCEEEKNGQKCKGHQAGMLVENIPLEYIAAIIEGGIQKSMGNELSPLSKEILEDTEEDED